MRCFEARRLPASVTVVTMAVSVSVSVSVVAVAVAVIAAATSGLTRAGHRRQPRRRVVPDRAGGRFDAQTKSGHCQSDERQQQRVLNAGSSDALALASCSLGFHVDLSEAWSGVSGTVRRYVVRNIRATTVPLLLSP